MRRWREMRDGTEERLEPAPMPAAKADPGVDWIGRGNDALAEGRLSDAMEAYARGRQVDPTNPIPWLNHGFAALESGQVATAHEDFRQCLSLAGPEDGLLHEVQFLIGRAYASEGRWDQAEMAYRASLEATPAFEEPRIALSELWLETGRPERVLDLVAAGQASSPRFALAHARSLHALGRHRESLAILEKLLAQDPGCVPALDGQGAVLLDLDRPGDALASFERAVRVGGPNAERLANLSFACQHLARLDEAVAYGDQALELSPGHARARWNRALAHLLRGELAKGWDDFEARWDAGAMAIDPRVRSHAPRWDGQDLRGRSILLDLEQGAGDMIQFLRYVPQLMEGGARVSVRTQPGLVNLTRRSFPGATVLGPEDALPPVDLYCELMSVPRHVGIDADAIPAAVPYLRADTAGVERWKAALADAAQGRLCVGLVWSGNPAHNNDRNRSIPLERLGGLAEVDALFVSLNPSLSDRDRVTLGRWPRLLDAGARLKDFSDTAAVVQALDLVISVDTSVAHLAGALGKPVWILLPWVPDWRWMLERDDSPWYPTARLHRQEQPQDWAEPFRRVRADLEQWVGGQGTVG